MARAITKSGIETTIYAFVVEHMGMELMPTVTVGEESVEYTDVFTVRGNKSENAAQALTERRYGKNSMVVHMEKKATAKLTLSASAFVLNSEVCETGKSYGHDTITAEFKVTYLTVMYRDDFGMHNSTLVYSGETTDSKLLNFAREVTLSKMCVVKSKKVTTERRWMPRDKYESLAKIQAKTKADNDKSDETDNDKSDES